MIEHLSGFRQIVRHSPFFSFVLTVFLPGFPLFFFSILPGRGASPHDGIILANTRRTEDRYEIGHSLLEYDRKRTNEETRVYIKDLDTFLCVKLE